MEVSMVHQSFQLKPIFKGARPVSELLFLQLKGNGIAKNQYFFMFFPFILSSDLPHVLDVRRCFWVNSFLRLLRFEISTFFFQASGL
jgi:hypothetical protein